MSDFAVLLLEKIYINMGELFTVNYIVHVLR